MRFHNPPFFAASLCLLLNGSFNRLAAQYTPADHKEQAAHAAIGFVEQAGQWSNTDGIAPTDILMKSIGSRMNLYIRKDNTLSWVWPTLDKTQPANDTLMRWDLQLVGENVVMQTTAVPLEEMPGTWNYYLPNCPQGATGLHAYKRVVYEGVYPNIDMHVWSNKWGYKIYFVVAPGGDPNDILLSLSGQDSLTVDQWGELRGWVGDKFYRFPHAIAYQEVNGDTELVPWMVQYHESLDEHLVNFVFQEYDTSQYLVIDISESDGPNAPERDSPYPEWGTYYGGGNGDEVVRMESIGHGGIVSCGRTWSLDFPVTTGIFVGTGSTTDAFITSFDGDYVRQMSTVLGGFGNEGFQAVKYGFNGHFICAGSYGSDAEDLLWTNPGGGAYVDDSEGWGRRVVICEFDEEGNRIWSTLFGANFICEEYDDRRLVANLDVNSEGDVILAGNVCAGGGQQVPSLPVLETNEPSNGEWPVTGGGFRMDFMPYFLEIGEGPQPVHYDGWIARFKPNRQLVWSTLFGGSSFWEGIADLAIDTWTDEVFITGFTTSPWAAGTSCTGPTIPNVMGFPWCVSPGGYNEFPLAGEPVTLEQAYVACFDADNELIWCSPFGKAQGYGTAISVSRSFAQNFTSVAIVGWTTQDDYGTSTPCEPSFIGWPGCNLSNPFTAPFSEGEINGFLVRFDADTKEMTWSTALTDMEPVDVTSYEKVVFVGANPVAPVPSQFLADEPNYFTALQVDDPGTQLVLGFDPTGLFYGSKYGGLDQDRLRAVAMTPQLRYYVAGLAGEPGYFPLNCPPQMGSDPPWCVFDQSGGGTSSMGS
jgi:hypothetical protein